MSLWGPLFHVSAKRGLLIQCPDLSLLPGKGLAHRGHLETSGDGEVLMARAETCRLRSQSLSLSDEPSVSSRQKIPNFSAKHLFFAIMLMGEVIPS